MEVPHMSVAIDHDPIPVTPIDEIAERVARVRAAFEAGHTRPVAWRLAQLERLKAMIQENGDRLLGALQADLGKPLIEAWTTDLAMVSSEVALVKKGLAKWMKPEKVTTPANVQPGSSKIVREPLGVVLVIAPWNYPVQLLLLPVIGAIAAGNAVVMKPSEVSSHTSALLGELVPKYLDPEAVQIIEGGVEETSELLAQRFDHIFYTGNGTVARIVMEAAAKHLTPVVLELGGKSPVIVDASADLDVTARRIAWGKFLNAGQTCIAPDYVLVHRSKEDELVEKIGAAVRKFYGKDPKASPDLGRIVNERHHRRLAVLLKDGEAAIGGEADEATRYIAPTVLRNVAPDSTVMSEEIFGPILPVLPVDDVGEAIRFVNERDKPLALYLFTTNPQVEQRVTEETSAGGMCVNGTIWQVANVHLPFGGVGPSGMGAYHGRASFETFSHRKGVVKKSLKLDPSMMYPPYKGWKTRLMKKLL